MIAGLCLVCATGCGDTPEVLIHDCLVFFNEVCDYQLRAVDEESAKRLNEVEFKVLKVKNEALKERIKMRFANIDKEQKKDYNDAWLDYYDEKVATGYRVNRSVNRLDAIIRNTSGPKEELTKVRDFPKSMLIDGAGTAGDSNAMFGRLITTQSANMGDGLVPNRFEFKKK